MIIRKHLGVRKAIRFGNKVRQDQLLSVTVPPDRCPLPLPSHPQWHAAVISRSYSYTGMLYLYATHHPSQCTTYHKIGHLIPTIIRSDERNQTPESRLAQNSESLQCIFAKIL